MQHRLHVPYGSIYVDLGTFIQRLEAVRDRFPDGNVKVSLDGKYPSFPGEKPPEDVGLLLEWDEPDTPEYVELEKLTQGEDYNYYPYDGRAESARTLLRESKTLGVVLSDEAAAQLDAIIADHEARKARHEVAYERILALEAEVAAQEQERAGVVWEILGFS